MSLAWYRVHQKTYNIKQRKIDMIVIKVILFLVMAFLFIGGISCVFAHVYSLFIKMISKSKDIFCCSNKTISRKQRKGETK